MNIFVLDDSPRKLKQDDSSKMMIEYSDVIYTHRVLDGDEVISESLYKSS